MMFRIETDAQKPGMLDRNTGRFHTFDDEKLKREIIPQHTKRLITLQKTRKETQKLPKFPDADFIKSLNTQEGSRTDPDLP